MKHVLAFLFCGVLAAQSVYLRDQPGGFLVKGASNATPIEITTFWAHGLVADQVIQILGVGGNTAANGVFKVKASTGSTTFTIKDASTGADIAGNGTFAATGGWALGGPVTAYSLVDHPRVFLDGPTGALTREIATDSANGLTNIVVTTDGTCAGGHLATVNLGYTPSSQLDAGDYIGVFNFATTGLNGSKEVKSVGATSITYCTTTPDATYTPVAAYSVVSLWAHSQNPAWTRMQTLNGTWYNLANYGGGSAPLYLSSMVMEWHIDRSKTTYRDKALAYLQEFEEFNISASQTFYVSFREAFSNGSYAGGPGTDYALFVMNEIGFMYSALRTYILANWTSDQKTTLYNKFFNERNEYWATLGLSGQTSCNRELNRQQTRILAESTAQTNSASTSTIVLNSSDTAVENYYIGDFIIPKFPDGSIYTQVYEITAYNATTKVATISGTWYYYTAPNGYYPAGQGYIIVPGATITNGVVSSPHATFTTDIGNGSAAAVGDIAVTGYLFEGSEESPITAISSATSITIANTGRTRANFPLGIAKKWEATSCGWMWYIAHHVASNLGSPAHHPPNGSSERTDGTNTGISKAYGDYGFLAAFAADDARAARLFEWNHMVTYDMYIRRAMDQDAGTSPAGQNYNQARNGPMTAALAMLVKNNVASFPSIAGLWDNSLLWLNIYGYHPAGAGPGYSETHTWAMAFGEFCGGNKPQLGCSGYWGPISPGMQTNRTAAVAEYYKNWLSARRGDTGGGGNYGEVIRNFLSLSPLTASTDYTTLPTQRLLGLASKDECVTRHGAGPCWTDVTHGSMVSRTGWTDAKDTQLSVLFAPFAYGDHTQSEFGVYRIDKGGLLVGTGHQSGYQADVSGWGEFLGDASNMIHIGTYDGGYHWQAYQRGFELSNPATQVHTLSDPTWRTTVSHPKLLRWGCGGSCGTTAAKIGGDANNRVVYLALDLKGLWNRSHLPAAFEASGRVHRHIVHMKKTGTQEIVAVYDDVDAGGSTLLYGSTVYPNNGEAWTAQQSTDNYLNRCSFHGGEALTEGTTAFADGVATSNNGTHGVATKFIAPASSTTIFLAESGPQCTAAERISATCTDKAGGLPAATGSKFYGYRVKACPSSNGTDCANAQTFEQVLVHRVQADTTSPTITASALSPTNWTGVETTDKVILFSRGGVLRTSVSYTAANAADHMIVGLAAGSYNITATNASPTSCAVNDTDTTCTFSASAGSVSVTQGSAPPVIAESGTISCTQDSACVFALSASGGTTPYAWSMTSGSLPTGMSFNATTHQFEGTPTQVTVTYPVIQVQGADAAASSVTFTVSVAPVGGPDPLAITTTTLAGGEQLVAYSATVSATGGVPPFSFDVSAGSLPGGLTMSSGGAITGTPTTIETQEFTARVTDSATPTPATDTQVLSITVTGPTDLAATMSLADVAWGATVSQGSIVSASGGTAPYTCGSVSGLPTGLTINASCALTGATFAAPGSYTVELTVSDSAGTPNTIPVSATFQVTTVGAVTLALSSVANESAIVALGQAGLRSGATCRVYVYDGNTLDSTHTPAMLFSKQQVVLAGLTAGTMYNASAVCGGSVSSPITFTTSTLAGTRDVRVQGFFTGAASLRVVWYIGDVLQTNATGTCTAGACSATLPSATRGSVIYYTLQYLAAGGSQIAAGRQQTLTIP